MVIETQVPREELINLDLTFARFMRPRLEAFRDQVNTYPSDLGSIEEWKAELDVMIEAMDTIIHSFNPDYPLEPYTPRHQEVLELFAMRLGHLWL